MAMKWQGLGTLLLALAAAVSPTPAAAQERAPERNAYFGETHIHTSWSVDAWLFGNRIAGPDQAYRYAQGQSIKHPMGYDIRIETPLDFMGVTDHAEYVGAAREANTPGSAFSVTRMPATTSDSSRGFVASRLPHLRQRQMASSRFTRGPPQLHRVVGRLP